MENTKSKNLFERTILMFALITAILFMLSSCKKYPEGPGMSIRTAKHRIGGSWNLTTCTINSQNALNFTYSDNFTSACATSIWYSETYSTLSDIWNFAADGEFGFNQVMNNTILDYTNSYNSCQALYLNSTIQNADNGTWQFQDDNKKLKLVWITGDVQVYDIIELREKRMQLRANINGDLFEMNFEQY